MEKFFSSISGRIRRFCGRLAERLEPIRKALGHWLTQYAAPAIEDTLASLGVGGYRRASSRKALQEIAVGVAILAVGAFFFETVSFWAMIAAILWSIAVWLYATQRE